MKYVKNAEIKVPENRHMNEEQLKKIEGEVAECKILLATLKADCGEPISLLVVEFLLKTCAIERAAKHGGDYNRVTLGLFDAAFAHQIFFIP